jgi:transposase
MGNLTTDENGQVSAPLLDRVQGCTRAAYADWLGARGEHFTAGIDVATPRPVPGRQERDSTRSWSTPPPSWTPFTSSPSAPSASMRSGAVCSGTPPVTRGRTGDPLYEIQTILRAGAENLTDKQRARLVRAFAAHAEHEAVALTWQCAQQLRTAYMHMDRAEGSPRRDRGDQRPHRAPPASPEASRASRTTAHAPHRWMPARTKPASCSS